VPKWIVAEGSARGLKMTLDTATMLRESVGLDLRRLGNELTKLEILMEATPAKPVKVSADDLAPLLGEDAYTDIFRLEEAVQTGERAKALAIAELLIDHGEEPMMIMGFLKMSLKRTWAIKAAIRDKLPENEVLGKTGLPAFIAKKVVARAREYDGHRLHAGLTALAALDRRLKTSQAAPAALLDQCLNMMIPNLPPRRPRAQSGGRASWR
jgi:DNA polymerase-3 subunit delta